MRFFSLSKPFVRFFIARPIAYFCCNFKTEKLNNYPSIDSRNNLSEQEVFFKLFDDAVDMLDDREVWWNFTKVTVYSVAEGFASAFFSISFTHFFQYFFLNIAALNNNTLVKRASSVVTSFLISVGFFLAKDQAIDEISSTMHEKFEKKYIDNNVFDNKSSVKMQSENIPAPNSANIRKKYKGAVSNILKIFSSTIKTSVGIAVPLIISWYAGAAIATTLTMVIGFNVAINGIRLLSALIKWKLMGYQTNLEQKRNEILTKIESLEAKIAEDPKRIAQANIDETIKEVKKENNRQLKEQERKLKFYNMIINATKSVALCLTEAAELVRNLYFIMKSYYDWVYTLSIYVVKGTEASLSSSTSSDESSLITQLQEVAKDTHLHVSYGNIKLNIEYDPSLTDSVIFENATLQVPKVGTEKGRGADPKDPNRNLTEAPLNAIFVAGKPYRFTGESGCGKSITFDGLLGLHHLIKGKIRVPKSFEYNPRAIQIVSNKTWINENVNLLNYLTNGLNNKESYRAEVKYLMKEFGLIDAFGGKLDSPVTGPSDGQVIRLYLIKAMISRAEVLLIDEGLAKLDANTQKMIVPILEKYANGSYEYGQIVEKDGTKKEHKRIVWSIEHVPDMVHHVELDAENINISKKHGLETEQQAAQRKLKEEEALRKRQINNGQSVQLEVCR